MKGEVARLHKEIMESHKVLKKRNKTLAKVVYLQMASRNLLYPHIKFDTKEFVAKRGKKSSPSVPPIKEAMRILGCNHRTAQDYVHFLEVLEKIDELSTVIMMTPLG